MLWGNIEQKNQRKSLKGTKNLNLKKEDILLSNLRKRNTKMSELIYWKLFNVVTLGPREIEIIYQMMKITVLKI